MALLPPGCSGLVKRIEWLSAVRTPTGSVQLSNIFQRQQAANMVTLSRLGFLPFIVLTGLLRQPEAFVGLFAVQLAWIPLMALLRGDCTLSRTWDGGWIP